MNIEIYAFDKIYSAKVVDCKGDYVVLECNGKIRRECNPAIAAKYRGGHKRRHKKNNSKAGQKANNRTANKEKEIYNKVRKNEVKDHTPERNIYKISKKEIGEIDRSCSCKSCGLMKRGECIGCSMICEHYSSAPSETEFERKRRLMI